MSAPLRRGACPSLAAPMLTGDGWLVRLSIAELTARQFAGLAAAAARLGNGLVEVTARGNLQVRGVTAASASPLAAALSDLGVAVAEGLPVVTGPLAGLDPAEIADPRPLASALRAAAAELRRRLDPKVSVVVDGGGALHLDAVPADLRLVATRDGWVLAVGGAAHESRPLGLHDAAGAVQAAVALLDTMAARRVRGRDLLAELAPVAPALPRRPPVEPIGRFGAARGFGLPFGQADAGMLAGLAAAAGPARFRPAPGRALIAVGVDPAAGRVLAAEAERLGFVVAADDPRLSIVACSGAPACASANLPTRRLAETIAQACPQLLGDGWRLHLSGCAKRCAQPAGPSVTLVGRPGGWELSGEGMPVPPGMGARLAEAIGRPVP